MYNVQGGIFLKGYICDDKRPCGISAGGREQRLLERKENGANQYGKAFGCRKAVIGVYCIVLAFFLCACGSITDTETEASLEDQWEEAMTTPLGEYPETVTYRLARLSIVGNEDESEEDDSQNNAYTSYLQRILNVRQEIILESSNLSEYAKKLELMIDEKNEMPDVMLITDRKLMDALVEKDLLEDLSQVYEQCTSDLIKEMYASYGDDFLDGYTYDGKLMGLPNTEQNDGVSLLWLRKDWMKELGLDDPQTPEEAYEIIRTFAETNPGGSSTGNAGLCFSLTEGNFLTQSFFIQPVFGLSGSYLGAWIPDEDGNIVYGSVEENTKAALAVMRDLYESGVLDQNFMLRTPENIQELINSGACGAVFGPWSLPYGYLQTSREELGAEWQPYLLCGEDGSVTAPVRYSKIACVAVRKGYEHPEIVPKILTAIYDYSRHSGAEDAKEINKYKSISKRWMTMPLVIDVNFKGSLQNNSAIIKEVLNGERDYEDTNLYVREMIDLCIGYLDGGDPEINEWITYTARIKAIDELNQAEISLVNEDYPELRDLDVPGELMRLEKEAFIKIITGEEDLDSFDAFVEKWYAHGGEELIRKANNMVDERDG